MRKKKVLFICTHNSARSQMAEGFLRRLYGDRYEAYSAGTEPSEVNPYAVRVMEVVGIDISNHRSKGVEEFRGWEFDWVATVCDQAEERCPFLPGAERYIHKGFPDPSKSAGDENEVLERFRKVRDEIKRWIEVTFAPPSSSSVRSRAGVEGRNTDLRGRSDDIRGDRGGHPRINP